MLKGRLTGKPDKRPIEKKNVTRKKWKKKNEKNLNKSYLIRDLLFIKPFLKA